MRLLLGALLLPFRPCLAADSGSGAGAAQGTTDVAKLLSGEDDDPLGLGAERRSPEDLAAEARERFAAKLEDEKAREVVHVDAPGTGSNVEKRGAADSGGDAGQGDLPQENLPLGEPDPAPDPAQEQEPVALERLRAAHPGTPESAIRALRSQEVELSKAKGAGQAADSGDPILDRLARTPQGLVALRRLIAEGSEAAAGTGRPEAGAGAGDPAVAGPQLPENLKIEHIAGLVGSTDPDKHAEGLRLMDARMQHMVRNALTGVAGHLKARDEAAEDRERQRLAAESEMAQLDRVLGTKWRQRYSAAAIRTITRAPGTSLAEAVAVNAVARGDMETVSRLSPKGQRERSAARSHQEGAGTGRGRDDASVGPDAERFFRALGHRPAYARGSSERSDADSRRALGLGD